MYTAAMATNPVPLHKKGHNMYPDSLLVSLPDRAKPKQVILPSRQSAILPRPSSPSHPPPKPYQPPDKICDSCKNEGYCLQWRNCPARAAQRMALDLNIKCERARPCDNCLYSGTECIDNPRKGKGQSLRVKRACASCRADKVQCEVDWPCKHCVKRKIQCTDPCRACGCQVPGCMSCAESSGTHHHYQESPAEASTSSVLQDKATPTSPSSPPESPLSPYSRQSPHNHAAVCVPDPDSHNSGSQGHNPPTPTPSPSPVFSIQPSLSQLHSTSLRDHNTILHMAAPTFGPTRYGFVLGRSCRATLLLLRATHSVLCRCHPVIHLKGRHSGLYDPPMESDESAPILSPLRMHSHPQALGSQPLQRSLPFTSPLTRPQAVDEPRKVTLPSFA
ncbi:hypothetical protein BU17DRAFT_72221 [Hysterangium stoloniferum]|nr:hypothetical protein BU17DRAFT_72221 [Hysterangium stoloniferum]